jgi:hypothetical protein
MVLTSNTIIERPLLHIINNVIIIQYLILKLPIHKRVVIMRENQGASRHCAFVYLKGKRTLVLDHQGFLKERVEVRIETT